MKGCVLALMILVLVACPAHAQQMARSADGTMVAYESYGSGEPTLVLVHGWTNNRTWWDPHLAPLARSFRVIALDLGGFGDSGKDRPRWTMEAMGEDVAAVVESANASNVVLVGFSMGGAAVLEAAKRLRGSVRGIVLVDIFQDPDVTYSEETIADIRTTVLRDWHDLASLRSSFSPGAADWLLQRYLDRTPSTLPSHWLALLDDFFRWSNRSLITSLSGATVPIEAINSERQPTDTNAYRRYVPTFRVTTMSEVGHLGVVWEKTDRFDRILTEIVGRFSSSQ
jgi:pimeloyl-ACP methyl ester carboxylesterase